MFFPCWQCCMKTFAKLIDLFTSHAHIYIVCLGRRRGRDFIFKLWLSKHMTQNVRIGFPLLSSPPPLSFCSHFLSSMTQDGSGGLSGTEPAAQSQRLHKHDITAKAWRGRVGLIRVFDGFCLLESFAESSLIWLTHLRRTNIFVVIICTHTDENFTSAFFNKWLNILQWEAFVSVEFHCAEWKYEKHEKS